MSGYFPIIQRMIDAPVYGVTFTTKQDNLSVPANSIVRWDGTGSTGITGLAAVNGTVTIINASTDYLLWLENENTASSAANRLMLPDGFWAFLMPGDTITLWYDTTTSRWRVLSWPTRGMQGGLTIFDDFVHGSLVIGSTMFGIGAQGTGSGVGPSGWGVTTTDRAMGAARLTTGTATTGSGWAGSYTSHTLFGMGNMLMVGAFARSAATDGTDTFTITCGISDFTADGAAWEYRWNGSVVEYGYNALSGGVATRTAVAAINPATVGNSYVHAAVFLPQSSAAADFLYSLDGVAWTLAGRTTTGLPTWANNSRAAGPYAGIVKSAGTTSRDCYLDYMGFRSDQAR